MRVTANAGIAAGAPLIVIADRDDEVRETISGFMSARGYRVERAADASTAERLLRSKSVEVLISDLELRSDDGLALIALARASAPRTRSIALAADGSPHHREAALKLGAVRVLAKPFSLLELADAVGLAHDCADGFYGWMHRMSLIDVLQMYHHAGQTLVLHIAGDVEGSIALRNGELIHAEHRGEVGMPALVHLLRAARGELSSSALMQATRTITGPFDHVLLDGLRALDEVGAPVADAPATSDDDWFSEAVAQDPLDREALRRWLREHAPGAGAWRVDPSAATLDRVDDASGSPEHELASAPGSLGWAYELAELSDPGWTRVELTSGAVALALVRASSVVIAFARMVAGDATQRQFHVESTRLLRWLTEHVGGAP